MLHAAAMWIALSILWVLATQQGNSAAGLAASALAAAASVLVAMRFGGAGDAFARAPRLFWTTLMRAGQVLRGGASTLRAAAAADITLKPGLVRVKTRARRPSERASFASMLSAAPGMVVVDADAEGLLVHALNEEAVDAAELGRLEALTTSAQAGVRQ